VQVPVASIQTNNLNCQGLLFDPFSTSLSISGKGKLSDTNAFIENKLARKSRFVSVMKFHVDAMHADVYEQLKFELEGHDRVGILLMHRDSVQLTLMFPSQKSQFSLFRNMEESESTSSTNSTVVSNEEGEELVLYAILLSTYNYESLEERDGRKGRLLTLADLRVQSLMMKKEEEELRKEKKEEEQEEQEEREEEEKKEEKKEQQQGEQQRDQPSLFKEDVLNITALFVSSSLSLSAYLKQIDEHATERNPDILYHRLVQLEAFKEEKESLLSLLKEQHNSKADDFSFLFPAHSQAYQFTQILDGQIREHVHQLLQKKEGGK
jgi:hypothetical protein